MSGTPGPGLYLHVPFCAKRCHYCDFNTYAGMDDLIPRYMSSLRRDIERVARSGPEAVAPPSAGPPSDRPPSDPPRPGPGGGGRSWPEFATIFIGGGTPTLVPARELARTLDVARRELPVAADVEITVEANPETVSVEQMSILKEAGVNRVSMGAQSFAPQVLAALGRWHDADRPLQAVQQVQAAGIERISLDLIYGTPAESEDDWRTSLATAVAAGIDHVSAYALTVEPNTEYARRVRADAALAPDDDVQAERMSVADAMLSTAGLARYELSNWARPGHECRHNLIYWRSGDWLGIGAGAHGHWQGRRWWSLRSPARYADAALADRPTVGGEELPTATERRTERLLLGLRTVEGVAREQVKPLDEQAVGRMVAAGLLECLDGRLRLTPDGFRVANGVTVALM